VNRPAGIYVSFSKSIVFVIAKTNNKLSLFAVVGNSSRIAGSVERTHGRGAGVGLGLGVGEHLPVHGVGVGVAVGLGVGVGVAVEMSSQVSLKYTFSLT